MGERYKGDLKIVAVIIGGTAPIHNFIVGICIIFLFYSIAGEIDMSILKSNTLCALLFVEPWFLLWTILEAATCWVVVKMAGNKGLLAITIKSCCLNLTIFWSLKICRYFSDEFWEEFLYYYYSYLVMFVIGILVVNKIMIMEDKRMKNKIEKREMK